MSNVTIKGFEIKNFDSGIVGQGTGTNNAKIEHNYIHEVGDGVLGSTSGTQALNNWTVSQNLITGFVESGVNLQNACNLLISKNKFSNSTPGDSMAILVRGQGCGSNSLTVSDVTIINNEIIDFPDRAVNLEAWAEGVSNATVENVEVVDNTITGSFTGITALKQGGGATLQNFTITGNSLTINSPKAAGCAVHLADVGGVSSFSNNTITINGIIGNGGNEFDGICISGADTGNWTITENELDGNNVGTGSGIRMRGSLPASASLNMEENTVTEWAQGILVDALASGTEVEVHRNWIIGNHAYGVSNDVTGATIDATLNYWGHESGPKHDGLNSSGQGNSVSDNVNFAPWYQDKDFKSRSDGTVKNTTKDKYYRSIQEAVDNADSGDTIHVMPGTYNESVIIGKSVTLTGDCGDENTPGPGPDAPILVGTGFKSKAAFRIEGASNVTIEGFEIKNYEGGYNSYGVFGYGTGVNNITIRHNYIHDVESDGVFAFNGYGVEVLSGWTVTHNVIENFGGEGG